jgi:hypothetical protein
MSTPFSVRDPSISHTKVENALLPKEGDDGSNFVLYVDNVKKRFGINYASPKHALDVVGHIRLQSEGADRLIFNNTTAGNIADVDVNVDGTNGGVLGIRTKVDGGSITEKLRINNIGAIGIDGANYGDPGDVIISNGSGSSVSWRTPVILGASLTNSFYTGVTPSSVVLYDNVEYETVSCYNALTGIFTAPRTAYYMVNAYARVTDFTSAFASRSQSFIYKKVNGVFTKYSATDFVDSLEDLKASTPRTNIIIYLNSGEEIRHQVVFPGNVGSGYLIRGDAFEIRCSYLSIHSIN